MASTGLPRVLRIPRSGGAAEDFILLHVSSAGHGSHDLKLIGTDGEDVYSVTVEHNETSSLTTKNFPGTQAQWEKTLDALLLGAEETEFTEGVEAIARVRSETSMTITIQKSIEGIKQKYGTIILTHTNEEEISLYNWCALTIQSKEDSSRRLAVLEAKLSQKEEEAKKLNESLAELVRIKNAYEDELTQKFSMLLNEKKLKIREQQLLLDSAKVDPEKLAKLERNRAATRDSLPGPSRAIKRRADAAAMDESDDDTDNGFEKMEIDTEDVDRARNSADEDERQTEDEESTADEDSTGEQPAEQLPTQTLKTVKASGSGTASTAANEIAVVPPKRDLPFAKKPSAATTQAVAPPENSDTESDDDEL